MAPLCGLPDNFGRGVHRTLTIPELAESIREDRAIATVAFDFPFSIPLDLLQNPAFAFRVAAPTFGARVKWLEFVEQRVELVFSSGNARAKLWIDPLLLGWRDKAFWIKRATDIATNAQPPLKHIFQNLFNMTVVGSKFLGSIRHAGMQVLLRHHEGERCLDRSVIETYPGAVAAAVGFTGSYKQKPECGLKAAEGYLREQGIFLDFNGEVRRFCIEYRSSQSDPDGADAFLCLVAAICFREGLAEWHTGGATAQQLDEEGCIVTPAKLSSSSDQVE
jgi:hypothetical protein